MRYTTNGMYYMLVNKCEKVIEVAFQMAQSFIETRRTKKKLRNRVVHRNYLSIVIIRI